MTKSGAGLHRRYLEASWQLIDLPILRDDPIGSVWYLHTQPPLFNLVVGAVLRWSPTPPIGTLFVLYMACLAVTGLVLTDILVRWRTPPPVAGTIAALAVAVNGPLVTVAAGSYEVPVTALIAVAVWLAQRHLDAPRPTLLIGFSAASTAVVMTRSMFHPAWLLAVLALVAVSRPVGWRTTLAAFAIPVLVVGGWMVKTEVLFGEATLSSWDGFNLQRGVTATIDRTSVEGAVADGDITPLALEQPFRPVDLYPTAPRCEPDRRHPAVEAPTKPDLPFLAANFNDTCFLPLYRESRRNAATILRREPWQYLTRRDDAMVLAFRTSPLGDDEQGPTLPGLPQRPKRTWMDELSSIVLLPTTTRLSTEGWNIPIHTVPSYELQVSPTLALGFLAVVVRSAWAALRLLRSGWRDRETRWAGTEVTWVLIGSAVLTAVVLSGLVELGENDRFRTTVDPFLIALPLGLAYRALTDLRTRRVTKTQGGEPCSATGVRRASSNAADGSPAT